MDSTAREVLALLLERLRDIEKVRRKDEAIMRAIVRAFCSGGPRHLEAYQDELRQAENLLARSPDASLDDVYAQLIDLLKDPAGPEKEKQDQFRRLLESFQGPRQ